VSLLRRLLYARKARSTPLARHYASTLPARSTPWAQARMLAVDFETSGLDPGRDRILSLGWVAIDGGRIHMASATHRLVRAAEVGHSATVHGLTDTDLEAGGELAPVLLELMEKLEGRALVAHAAGVELGFLSAACRRCFGVPPTLRVIDTLALERRLRRALPEEPGALRLHACRERHGLPEYRAHDAAIDALACAELLLAQASQIRPLHKLRLADLL
jgi:DNA polymerase III subunit epsilon